MRPQEVVDQILERVLALVSIQGGSDLYLLARALASESDMTAATIASTIEEVGSLLALGKTIYEAVNQLAKHPIVDVDTRLSVLAEFRTLSFKERIAATKLSREDNDPVPP